ncbi:DNA-directed RNA polymerase core subunit rpc10 [Lithohypha guttulata]|uniref:DNA-directed RNA polymerase core subunit rpc10 n=1 Tax=Lithohypha guttulata TaxID=1690604 RepID=A0AAN7YL84_9EURO|nr:DNA-directed RNA polymerase core subunit rpc10 [Lithohypha guttulata]KAK5091066.1 DNA-directed RNA polymerase core subunit rpc10 [Lithohypha guttulata]
MSQREAYQFPSSSGGAGTGYAGYDTATGPKVTYICGECSAKVPLEKEDKVRCPSCGHRVLYKERTKR